MKSSTELVLALVLALAGQVLFACATPPSLPDDPPPAQGVEVQVLIYSGRPNPVFTLVDPASAAGFAEALDRATVRVADGADSVIPSRLGYAGMLVRDGDQRIEVYRGDIRVDGRRALTDGGALEAWLLERAVEREALSEAELRVIRGR